MKFNAGVLIGALGVVLAIPLVLQSKPGGKPDQALSLVIISPHNEAIRYEFGQAFSQWHQQHYGTAVDIDWRVIGGTSEIIRYLEGQYTAAFRAQWQQLGHSWTKETAAAFNNPKINPDDQSGAPSGQQARAGFLASQVGAGIDLFFGGGQFEFSKQAACGYLVPCGYRDTPEGKSTLGVQIPENIGGESWYDRDDRWYGVVLSAFGICYNQDLLAKLPSLNTPTHWQDLCQPGLRQKIALADPTKSGSANKAYEMIVQEQMALAAGGLNPASPEYSAALAAGWKRGLNVIQLAGANARYFSDAAGKVPLDVALGDAAAGMCIDFYGMVQANEVVRPDGSSRLQYLSPVGGTSVSCDPIGMLRGAPHRELALQFIQFTLSPEGQKLWGQKPGTPGGPEKYRLCRMPIRRDFYTPATLAGRTYPEADPYLLAGKFEYHGAWTGALYGVLRSIIKAMCLDPHEELRAAWEAVIEQGGPSACPQALEILLALPEDLRYENIFKTKDQLTGNIAQVRLLRQWCEDFRAQYRQAERIAQFRKSL